MNHRSSSVQREIPVPVPITHRTGNHCGSSALRDLLEFHGLSVSEAFCFGLGSGLGITYLTPEGAAAPFMVHVRSLGFEERVFEAFSPALAWDTFESPDAAMRGLEARLDDGRPALLLTDIYHLPYYESRTHFPGHAIMAWRRNPETGEVMVTDTERPEPLAVQREKLGLARFSDQDPFRHRGHMAAPDSLRLARPLRDAAHEAVRVNARLLLSDGPDRGIAALDLWRRELPRWAAAPEWRWTARFAYQVIEKRGTGGGGFRKMYADFLDELAAFDAGIGASGLPQRMRESAAAWTRLAMSLKAASEAESLPVAEIDLAIAEVERAEQRYAAAALQA